MSKSSHLRALLKKNLLISKSTFIVTIIEIFAPIVIMALLLLLKKQFDIQDLEFYDDIEYISSNSTYITEDIIQANDMRISYRGFIYLCSERNLIGLVGEDFPDELFAKFYFHKWELKNAIFKNYKSLDELLEYIDSKDYGKDKINFPELCFAVSFEKKPNKYTYKLHYFASPYKRNTPDVPSTELGVGDPLSLQPDYSAHLRYIQSGFFMGQKLFYDYVLQTETRVPTAKIDYIIGPKKYDKCIKDPFADNISLLLTFFTIIAYALPMTINVYRIVKEKETRAKEGMKIMGLNEFTYFLSYFIIYFILNLFYAGFNTWILKSFLIYIEPIYIFIQYVLYGLVVYSLIYFFQSFLERTRIAVIVSLLIYALMFFLCIPVIPNSVSKGVKILFCILFPPVSLQLGIDTLAVFEMNYNKFDGRIYYEFSKFSVFDMYIVFVVSFFLFMFIGFYLQNILSHEYGIKKPWYFLCTKSFYGCENKESIKVKNDLDLIDKNENSLNRNVHINNVNQERIISYKMVQNGLSESKTSSRNQLI